MTTIRHTTTLFEYDGPQLFEARDDEGGQYLALLVAIDPVGHPCRTAGRLGRR